MFRILANGTPKAANKDVLECDGAYIVALIDFVDEEGAELLCRHYADMHGFSIDSIDECQLINPEVDNSDLLAHKDEEYFDEAKRLGYCMIYHTWTD